MKKKNLVVMFGGPSVEHDVSLITGLQVLQNADHEKYNVIPIYWTQNGQFVTTKSALTERQILQQLKTETEAVMLHEGSLRTAKSGIFVKGFSDQKIDCIIPAFHGSFGEDGKIQGFIETLDVPYSGCDTTASVLGMDKNLFKIVMRHHKIEVLDWQLIDKNSVDSLKISFPFPVIVKPAHLGSSIGVKKCEDTSSVKDQLRIIFELDTQAIIEPYLKDNIEINCSVLGTTENCEASVCEQPLSSEQILSFEDKYLKNGKGKKGSAKIGMASLDRRIPAPISNDETEKIQNMAVKIFQACGCSGVARVDFMIDKKTNTLFVTEINTIPGSLSYYLWEASGISFREQIDRLVNIAEFEYKKKKSLLRIYPSAILSKITA